MPTIIWSVSCSEEKYVGEIGKERFIRIVAKDMKVPQDLIRRRVVKATTVEEWDIAYPHFHKVVKYDGNGILKILEP